MSNFTHLHVHTQYSLLDGVCRLNELLDTAVSLGQSSIAITDHGVMYGVVDFYKLAKSKGIKPIIGCEVYVASRSRFQKEKAFDYERHHLILLCKNEIGYKNLIKIVSESFINGFYVKPRIDKELLEKYHEGLIALSGCISGEVATKILNDNYSDAKETALWFDKVFGRGNYYLEMQNHGMREQLKVNDGLKRISSETGIPLVATNDVHYIKKNDHLVQKVLICVQTNKTINDENTLEFEADEFYFKSESEMRDAFSDCQEAIDNTGIIAKKCNFDFEFGNIKLPHFEVPDNISHFDYFKNQCILGFEKKYGNNAPKDYIDRLQYEIDVINEMGYVDYFLIVSDFISFAKSKSIPVGPGRGSGAGSIAAYCIGITGIDPMKHNLLFERFLNPERISMPDFDIDFCYERRGEVIDYVNRKYGNDHVAQIITFGTLAARAAVRDVGRALGMSYQSVDVVAKLIPHELNITIDRALTKSSELKEQYENNDETKLLLDMARRVEGMPRHASTHAAGVVITKAAVDSYVPLALNDDNPVTQFPMTTLEDLGLLKMDFLGLRTLTVIDGCVKMIKNTNQNLDIESIDMDDSVVYDLFSKGQTVGVFQFESAGMKNVLMQLKPENIEDIIAVISLYRPGPMDSIPMYIKNRHNPKLIRYKSPLLKKILSVTYGCIVYQEQVMQVFRELAGYSYGRADVVRRAMSKKKKDVMEKERQNFIYGITNSDGTIECDGAVNRGLDAQSANEIFDQMSSFSQYAFNKSHAAAYAYVAYQTAYLKLHYPCEFMAALISSVLDNTEKVAEYIEECNRLNIKIMHPDVNTSIKGFTTKDGKIIFGLLAVKNLGANAINSIVNERDKNGEYESFYSFCSRTFDYNINKRAFESLIFSGSLDTFGLNRKEMLNALPLILKDLENKKKISIEGQIALFGLVDDIGDVEKFNIPKMGEFDENDKLRLEKEYTGIYITGHPLQKYSSLLNDRKIDKISDLLRKNDETTNYNDFSKINLLVMLNSVKLKETKNNDTMAFVVLEDMSGTIEGIVFPKVYIKNMNLFSKGNAFLISGKLSSREDEETKIIVENVILANDIIDPEYNKIVTKKLYLKFEKSNCPEFEQVQNVLNSEGGNDDVYYYFSDSKKTFLRKDQKIHASDRMIDSLKVILGDKNVFLKQWFNNEFTLKHKMLKNHCKHLKFG